MKNLIIVLSAFTMFTFAACAQTKNKSTKKVVEFPKADADVRAGLNNVLTAYYGLKDALVADDEATAKAKAKDFLAAMEKVDEKKMTIPEHIFYTELADKIKYDAGHIKSAPNIEHMREHFNAFSKNIWELMKAFKANNGTAMYKDYCPMQKAFWISKEEGIKNPYYGKQMLECGNVEETVK